MCTLQARVISNFSCILLWLNLQINKVHIGADSYFIMLSARDTYEAIR